MAAIAKQLFDWDAVEARSDLDRFFLARMFHEADPEVADPAFSPF